MPGVSRGTGIGMRRVSTSVRVAVAASLFLMAAVSGAFFIIAMASSGDGYDAGKVKLEVDLRVREELMTCAYKVYGDDNQRYWVAKTVFKNVGEVPVYDLQVFYMLEGYSDWNTGKPYPVVLPGQTVRDFCWPSLDGEEVMKVTTKTPVELVMKYQYRGLDQAVEMHEKLFLLGKNDFVYSSLPNEEQLMEDDEVSWHEWFDNYEFIAAFVTPNEETTKRFAQEATGGLAPKSSDDEAVEAVNCIFDALYEHGVRYVHEPATFWTSDDGQYVQYPKECIERRSGTCLDLAVLFASLCEAVGLQTYVAFVPGHALPIVVLPESGNWMPVESTAVDFTDSEYMEYIVESAWETIQEAQDEGKFIGVDIEKCWEMGMMPPW